MKHLLSVLFLLFASKISFSQEHKVHTLKYIFNPKADARHDVDTALVIAGKEHKRVFVLIGGDWSDWSLNFLRVLEKEYVKKALDDNYVFVKVNFSPSNKNDEVLKRLESPKFAGYPVIVILDESGKKIVAQNTDELKITPGWYFGPKVEQFLKTWAKAPPKK